MADTFFRTKVLGRRIHAVGLGSSILAFTMAVTLLIGRNDAGQSLDTSGWGVAIGITAALAVISLWGGWWLRSKPALRLGLLLAAGVFLGRIVFNIADGAWTAFGFSLGSFVITGLSYLLEVEPERT